MTDFNKLATQIYEQNKAVGWWDDPDRCIYQTLQLISTEVAEATEGERKGLMDDHLPHRKMAEVELADALIRVLDIGGRYEWRYIGVTRRSEVDSFITEGATPGKMHLGINRSLIGLTNWVQLREDEPDDLVVWESVCRMYSMIINGITQTGELCGYDIVSALHEKLDYNKERADHKRENREKEGGKKF